MKEYKTGIYIRVSTDEQVKHGFSIRAQKEKLFNYAKVKDWKIYNVYIDEGLSGKNLERPEVQKLLSDIKNEKVNNVLVFKIDRLTRSTKDLIDLIELFQKYNCDFNSLTESIDTSSPTGRMFIKIIGLFAEFERETIVERIKVGLERKVKEGYSLCSSTPSYGYTRKKGQKIQIIDIKEAAIVKKIYNMFLADKTVSEIKRDLNRSNIKTKKNKEWTNKAVVNILTNPNYIGNVRYGINTKKYFERRGKHQNIITEEQFLLVKDKLKNRLRTKEDAYFSNKLICICNHKFQTKRTYINSKCYINYLCKNKDCQIKSISHNNLEKYFKIQIKTLKEKRNFVQEKISKIVICNSKKSKLIVYNCVNIMNANFTLKRR